MNAVFETGADEAVLRNIGIGCRRLDRDSVEFELSQRNQESSNRDCWMQRTAPAKGHAVQANRT
jgi:hypothetical protein